jgi:hypothetical protein
LALLQKHAEMFQGRSAEGMEQIVSAEMDFPPFQQNAFAGAATKPEEAVPNGSAAGSKTDSGEEHPVHKPGKVMDAKPTTGHQSDKIDGKLAAKDSTGKEEAAAVRKSDQTEGAKAAVVDKPNMSEGAREAANNGKGAKAAAFDKPNKAEGAREKPNKTEGAREPANRPNKAEGANAAAFEKPNKTESAREATVEKPNKTEGAREAKFDNPRKTEAAQVAAVDRANKAENTKAAAFDKANKNEDAKVATGDKPNKTDVAKASAVQNAAKNEGFRSDGFAKPSKAAGDEMAKLVKLNSSAVTNATGCIASQVDFNFRKSKLKYNNLQIDGNGAGGFMLFSDVGVYKGESFDLKITTLTPYKAKDATKNGLLSGDRPCTEGCDFAQINLKQAWFEPPQGSTASKECNSVDLRFSFISKSGDPIEMPSFSFSVFDVDSKGQDNKDKTSFEQIYSGDHASYNLLRIHTSAPVRKAEQLAVHVLIRKSHNKRRMEHRRVYRQLVGRFFRVRKWASKMTIQPAS